MLSLVPVQCPYCQAKGQIIMPPLGSLILGPCPECHDTLLIFMGRCLALDQEIIKEGDIDAKRDHITDVLTEFLRERVEAMFTEEQAPIQQDQPDSAYAEMPGSQPQTQNDFLSQTREDIRREVDLVDNAEFFKKTFPAK